MINESNPVIVASEIEVAASPEIIWDMITEIEHWPNWNPDVKWASLEGRVTEGSKFLWKAGVGTIISTIQYVEPPCFLAWTDKTLGINALHIWQLDSQNGHTIVKMEESWEGLVVQFFHDPMQKMLENTTDTELRHLKTEAERRSAS